MIKPWKIGALVLATSALPCIAQIDLLDERTVEPAEDSPFFAVQQEATEATADRSLSVSATFPKDKGSDRSAGQMFTGFFTDMFSSIRFGPRLGDASGNVVVEPSEFRLDERREVDVEYVVINRTDRMFQFDFPTQQRLEIVVRDSTGAVVERWSEDRFFDERESVLMINPKERVEYQERIATRELKPGTTYTVEASIVEQPELTRSQDITTLAAPIPAPNPESTPPAP